MTAPRRWNWLVAAFAVRSSRFREARYDEILTDVRAGNVKAIETLSSELRATIRTPAGRSAEELALGEVSTGA